MAKSVTLSSYGQIGRRSVEEEEREKKKKAWPARDLGGGGSGGGGTIWVGQSLAGRRGVLSLLALSLSISLFVCEGWKPFEGKIETEIDFRLERGILQSKLKLISVDPIFLCLPNTYRSIK